MKQHLQSSTSIGMHFLRMSVSSTTLRTPGGLLLIGTKYLPSSHCSWVSALGTNVVGAAVYGAMKATSSALPSSQSNIAQNCTSPKVLSQSCTAQLFLLVTFLYLQVLVCLCHGYMCFQSRFTWHYTQYFLPHTHANTWQLHCGLVALADSGGAAVGRRLMPAIQQVQAWLHSSYQQSSTAQSQVGVHQLCN